MKSGTLHSAKKAEIFPNGFSKSLFRGAGKKGVRYRCRDGPKGASTVPDPFFFRAVLHLLFRDPVDFQAQPAAGKSPVIFRRRSRDTQGSRCFLDRQAHKKPQFHDIGFAFIGAFESLESGIDRQQIDIRASDNEIGLRQLVAMKVPPGLQAARL